MDDEPRLGPHLFWIWSAFTDLNYRRGAGFSGPVPLNYSDIEAYCRLKGIYSLGDRERLLRLLEPLDRKWMADAHAASETRSKGAKTTDITPAPPPARRSPRNRTT